MFKYVLKRIGLAFVTICIILSLTFILLKLLPFEKAIGEHDARAQYYNEYVSLGYLYSFDEEKSNYGELVDRTLDESTNKWTYYYEVPILKQYGSWVKNIVFHWEWGTSNSISPNVPALEIIKDKLPATIKVNIVATILSVPLGIALGILSALKKDSKFDNITQTIVMLFISIPSFVLISVLLLVLAFNLEWLPTIWPTSNAPLKTQILGYVIPVLALSFGSIAYYTRFVRAELSEVMSSEYLLLARTKGLTRSQAIRKHALKNAMVPIFPVILGEVIMLLSGSIVLERLYGIPGIGDLFIESLARKDYNILLANMAVFTSIGLFAAVVIDISYGFIDPRIRMGAKK